ncbi:ROK family transcriptional regulator [Actinophytocola glycyrrhizae]|uniref:ROK family protein n=1 Tax=Actinophytocola glycyrrhizae TaxID=2044873 RepID=A0ABV9RZR9_9PSEU
MAQQAGSSRLLRGINESAALRLLLDRGPLTRGDLRELTGLAKPTTSDVMRRLQDAGLARVIGRTSGGPGPNADIYDVNPDAAYAAAVSLREKDSSLVTAVCDLSGEVRARVTTPLAQDPVRSVADAVRGACRAAKVDRLDHVQLGVPGAHHDGTIRYVDVPGWSRPGLIDDIRARLATLVSVDNDVNLAAAAERARGVAKDAESFALLWLGEEGLGLGIDLGGRIIRGARGGAGEIGYMPAGPDGDFQELVGGPAILALARKHGIGADRAATAATDERLLRPLASRIAYGIAAVVAVLDPELVVLAGEVGQAGGAALADAVGTALRELSVLDTEIAATTLTEDAVLLGALDTTLTTIRTALLTRRQETP